MFSTTGEEETDKWLMPHAGIEPVCPNYLPSMLTTTPMGLVIIPLQFSMHNPFDSSYKGILNTLVLAALIKDFLVD